MNRPRKNGIRSSGIFMKRFGLVLFISMLVIHIAFFVVPRRYPPESILVAFIGIAGAILMFVGHRYQQGKSSSK